jgi:hypothetical protein
MKPLFALATLALAATAQAQVITIDQAKALAGNVTPGDAPGFPITISQAGSYRLMSNLTVADAGSTAIKITHPHVTLDLNGFTVQGPILCSAGGAPNVVSCTSDGMAASARGHGIEVYISGTQRSAVLVKDGTVTGFAGPGISGLMGDRPVDVLRMRVTGNGGAGIVQARSIAESSVVGNKDNGAHLSFRIVDTFFGNNGGWAVWGGWVRHNVYHHNTLGGRASNVVDLQ